jgi:hypothetical protein
LNKADLNTFLDASHTLWELTDEVGQKKFGENFHTNSFLLQFHQFNAGQRDADHVHDGNGFLTQHLKFTNIFEKVSLISSIFPLLTLIHFTSYAF